MLDCKCIHSDHRRPLLKAGLVRNESGLALLTVMLFLVLLMALGVTAITVSGLENKMAGMQRTMETAASAAESCLGTGVNVLQQVFLPENASLIPPALLEPSGPVPVSNKSILEQELLGNPENGPDVSVGSGAAPNLRLTVGAYSVTGDIDRLFAKAKAGSGQQQNAAYDGAGVGVGANGVDVFYRIECVATNAATGTESRVAAVYACALTGDGCQRQP